MKNKQKIITFLSLLPWFLAGILFLPFVLLKDRRQIKKVIIFMHSKIGDFVAQTPLSRELKRHFPKLLVAVILTNSYLKDLIKCDPNIDEIIFWDEKATKLKKVKLLFKLLKADYNWSFNLSMQSWLDFIAIFSLIPNRVSLAAAKLELILKLFYKISNTLLITYPKGNYSTQVYLGALRFLGINSTDIRRQLYPCLKDKKFVEGLIERFALSSKKYIIGINVSCGNRLKQWSEKKFAKLADMILDTDKAAVVFLGSGEDRNIIERVMSYMKHYAFDFSGLLNLGQLAAFCEKIDLFLSVDSGPLYIANAVGSSVIDITGPVDVKELPSFLSNFKFVQPDLPCVPCSYVISPARTCRLGTRECLEKTSAEKVFQKIKEIIHDI